MILSALFLLLASGARALPVEMVAGEILIGGGGYGAPDYQTFLGFNMVGQTRAPKRNYLMTAQAPESVYLDHPVQPAGEYEYQVRMPYHASQFAVDDAVFYPVWYSGCVWKLRSNIQTPEVTTNSPQFLTVSAPFTLAGSSNFYGAYSTGFRLKGRGTAELKFEKVGTKYFVREARYIFTNQSSFDQNVRK